MNDQYKVTLVGGGLGINVIETVLVSLASGGRGRPRWIAERRRMDHNWCAVRSAGGCVSKDRDSHDWIDGRACPALGKTMAALPDAVRADAAQRASGKWVTATDTLEFTLTAPRSGARGVSITGETIGPGATWWNNAEQAMAGCWSPDAPTVSGRAVPARLAE